MKAAVSFCPLCQTRNQGPAATLAQRKKKAVSIVHTCHFCQFTYCSNCGEDATSAANHFGYFSDTNCGLTRYGVNKIALEEERGMCTSVFRTIGFIILGILLCPFFLIFFCPIMVPYILQSKANSTCVKILLIFCGILLGLIMIPLFITSCLIYFIYFIAVRSLALCGCEDCDCCSLNAAGVAYANHNNAQSHHRRN